MMTDASLRRFCMRIAGPVTALLLLAACAAAPARAPDTHYDLQTSIPPLSFGVEGSVMLRRVDVRGLQSGRPLITMVGEDPVRFREQRGHFWHVATPTLVERGSPAGSCTQTNYLQESTNSCTRSPPLTVVC